MRKKPRGELLLYNKNFGVWEQWRISHSIPFDYDKTSMPRSPKISALGRDRALILNLRNRMLPKYLLRVVAVAVDIEVKHLHRKINEMQETTIDSSLTSQTVLRSSFNNPLKVTNCTNDDRAIIELSMSLIKKFTRRTRTRRAASVLRLWRAFTVIQIERKEDRIRASKIVFAFWRRIAILKAIEVKFVDACCRFKNRNVKRNALYFWRNDALRLRMSGEMFQNRQRFALVCRSFKKWKLSANFTAEKSRNVKAVSIKGKLRYNELNQVNERKRKLFTLSPRPFLHCVALRSLFVASLY